MMSKRGLADAQYLAEFFHAGATTVVHIADSGFAAPGDAEKDGEPVEMRESIEDAGKFLGRPRPLFTRSH